MADPLIAPETQRLAEDNNVDWRSLAGTGEGGEVLERDVLDHLTQVMMGGAATDPTPEPLPEGLSAWPEEVTRRGRADDLFAASFGTPKPDPTPEPSPWRMDAPAASPETEAEPGGFVFEGNPPAPSVQSPGARPFSGWAMPDRDAAEAPPNEAAETTVWGEAPTPAQPGSAAPVSEPDLESDLEPAPEPVLEAAVPESASEAVLESASVSEPDGESLIQVAYAEALEEIQTLRARLAMLEEERLRHVGELHQLSRMQETIALQKNEGAKLGVAQSEIERLKTELAAVREEAKRTAALAIKNRDLEDRLTRARTFRQNAKAEYEKLLADHMMLEHESANLKKRRGFKLWGK